MQQVVARKNVQKTKPEAAENILDPWNQQYFTFLEGTFSAQANTCPIGLTTVDFQHPKRQYPERLDVG